MKLGLLSLLATSITAVTAYKQVLSGSTYQEAGHLVSTTLSATSDSGLQALCDPGVESSAGFFTIDAKTKKNYFYWFFQSRSIPASDPIVLWLTGGPGCSSELALLTENGPCLLGVGDKAPKLNPYGWNAFSNLLYVDQPAGTGFSTGNIIGGYDSNEAEVSTDLYHFLIDFLKAYPEYQGNDFFITGESYAGHYVPATAHRVWLGNKNKESEISINLKGLAIGNGLTAPEIQYNYYPEMAYNFTMELTGSPAVSLSAYQKMVKAVPTCISMIADCQTTTSKCSAAQTYCNNALMGPYQSTGKNVYNVRLPCVGSLCYDFSAVDTFLNLASTKKALGVSSSAKWAECSNVVNLFFANDWMKNFDNQIPDLLEDGIRVLIYAGDLDFICNWIGNKAWTLDLPWSGQAQYKAAADLPWSVNGVVKGKLRNYNNFSFLQMYEAGHLVPMDQPEAALAMLKEFVTGKRLFSPRTSLK